jgi:hypothetical protein
MNSATLEAAWNTQPHGRITIDLDVLVDEVRQNDQQFRTTIFLRDVREIGIALFLVPIFWFMGQWLHKPWTWYLIIPALLWIAGFLIVDRYRRKNQRPTPGLELRPFVQSSLAEVRHQIWLLRNVFWWYLLPIAAALTVSSVYRNRRGQLLEMVVELGIMYTFFWGLWWVNQFAVRKDLNPRAVQLEKLLRSVEA